MTASTPTRSARQISTLNPLRNPVCKAGPFAFCAFDWSCANVFWHPNPCLLDMRNHHATTLLLCQGGLVVGPQRRVPCNTLDPQCLDIGSKPNRRPVTADYDKRTTWSVRNEAYLGLEVKRWIVIATHQEVRLCEVGLASAWSHLGIWVITTCGILVVTTCSGMVKWYDNDRPACCTI